MAEIVVFGVVVVDVVLRVQRIPALGDHINAEALASIFHPAEASA